MFGPFSTGYNTGYRFSALNYDTLCGYFPNAMNLRWNTAMADLSYRSSMYYYPVQTFNPFSSYSGISIPYDAIFQQTMAQFDAMSKQYGGPGLYDANGKINLAQPLFNGYVGGGLGSGYGLGFGGMMPGQNGYLTNPLLNQQVNPNDNGNGNGNGIVDADRKNREITALKKLFTTYKAVAKNLDEDTVSKINNALTKSGNIDEQLTALQDLYKSIDKTALKKTIPNLIEFREQLVQAGFDFEDANYSYYSETDIADLVENALNDLNKTVGDNGVYGQGLVALTSSVSTNKCTDDTNDILRVISAWNEKKDESIVVTFAKYVSTNGNPIDTKSNIELHVKPFVDALQKEVTFFKERAADTSNFETLEKFSRKLGETYERVYNSPTDTNIAKLGENFDKLYVLLRKCEAKRINDLVEQKYSFLNNISNEDTDFVNGLIVSATEADLVSEGLADIDIRFREDGTNIEADLQALCTGEKPYLKEFKTSDGRKFYITAENASRDDIKIYELVDGELKQVKNCTVNGNKINIPEETEYEEGTISPDTIQDEIDALREAEEQAEQAKKEGAAIARDTHGKYKATVNSIQVAAYTAKELLDVIPAYDSNENTNKTYDGYYETLTKTGVLTKADVLKQVNSVLELAENKELTGTPAYKKLQAVAQRYAVNGNLENAPDLESRNKTERNWWNYKDKQAATLSSVATCAIAGTCVAPGIGTIIGAAIGFVGGLAIGKVSDIEVIDDCMSELCKELKDAINGDLV